jgi:hypothetical protein
MNEEQQRILNYLNQNAIGYSQRRSSEEIRTNCGLESGGVTNEHVRELIRDMIVNHNCCIGSLMWVRGFWIINTEEELNRVTESLRRRANSIAERADQLRTNWENRNNNIQ